ncbi:MAG: thioredoxin family protein [Bacteroidales bacterium]
MLKHLSPGRFSEVIADFQGPDKWHFKCTAPTLILFRTKDHLFAKGFRDVYEPINQEFPQIQTYEVLEDEDPQIATAYDITNFPATLFIKPGNEAKIVQGYLSPEEAVEDVKRYLIN